MTRHRALRGCHAAKFDSCNNLLSSVHTLPVNVLRCVRLYIKLLSSLWVSRTESASDWRALQEALYKCIDQYNTNENIIIVLLYYIIIVLFPKSDNVRMSCWK